MRTDGWTDGRAGVKKLIAFLEYANAPKQTSSVVFKNRHRLIPIYALKEFTVYH
jgi:hypothetical protein